MMFHNFDKPWEHREEEEGESRRRRRRLFQERSRNGTESRMRRQRELEDGLGGLSEEQNLVMVMMVVRMAVIVNWVGSISEYLLTLNQRRSQKVSQTN